MFFTFWKSLQKKCLFRPNSRLLFVVLIICCSSTLSVEREQEFTLTETTPTSPSPGSYSPARSVQSVDVSSASSPTAALSPEYTGVTTSTGETGLALRWTNSALRQVSRRVATAFTSVFTRRRSVIYLVPYIHSDNSRRRHAGDGTAAVLYEEQRPRPSPVLHPQDAGVQRGIRVIMTILIRVVSKCLKSFRSIVCFICRYTGSYNYGSYTNQHPHSIQSQYQSLGHDPAIPAPLHYSAYHRSSAQVSLTQSGGSLVLGRTEIQVYFLGLKHSFKLIKSAF